MTRDRAGGPLKIALIHYSVPPVVGGVERVLAQHARLMAGAGHQVRIIAGRGEPTDPRVDFARVPLVDSRHPHVLAAKSLLDRGQVPDDFEGLVASVGAALRPLVADVDVLIAHNVYSLHKNLALTAALRDLAGSSQSPRVILWHHDLAWTTPRYRAELHPGYPWDLLRTRLQDAAQVVVSESRQHELAGLLGMPGHEIIVVPNGIDAAAFLKLEPETRELYQRLELERAGPILLLPARLTPRKNVELALRALACLRETCPGAALIVTGPPGPHNPANDGYAAHLRELEQELGLQGSAHFLAEISGRSLPDGVVADFYRLADALFFPSREEGFGIPLLEAGLANLPIFCADIAPLRMLGGDQARYFPPDADPKSVAALIASELRDDARYALRLRVRQGYSWDRIYGAHIAPLLED